MLQNVVKNEKIRRFICPCIPEQTQVRGDRSPGLILHIQYGLYSITYTGSIFHYTPSNRFFGSSANFIFLDVNDYQLCVNEINW